jgi:hypothetical protein
MALIEINWKPSRTELRRFALIWFPAFCALVAWIVWRRTASTLAPTVIAATGVLLGAAGAAVPAVIRPVFLGLTLATFPIGFVVSHVILAVVYFGLFTPMGLLMRAFGRDPMRRTFDRAATTYWVKREPDVDPKRYFKQY